MLKMTTLLRVCALGALAFTTSAADAPIDRHALVTRHNPVHRKLDVEAPLSVGNGEFAFTADITGLQTFAEAYEQTIPLGTLSQWGWHTWPNPEGWTIEKFHFKEFESHGREVGYADIPGDQRTPEINWLRSNPHRLHLGRIGFRLTRADGKEATATDLTDVEQTLDMWTGVLVSHFKLDGQAVEVQTVCHPERDLLAVRVSSPLVRLGRIQIQLHFPYGTGQTTAADWTKPEAHKTVLTPRGDNAAEFTRTLDADSYRVATSWAPAGTLSATTTSHQFLLTPGAKADSLEFVAAFTPQANSGALPSFEVTRQSARAHWNHFWLDGGAIDLSQSRDPRWRELERRIVLSQYLTAIQCAGRYPPQETGLTFNSWEGKFHLEMHWWHAAHFALWNRTPMLERSLGFYRDILPRAKGTAQRQGYAGARWPKMTNPNGAESPSSVGPFLIWQQPHPIFYAELSYRAHPDRATLERFKGVIFETAEFMASYAAWDESTKRYVLGPTLQGAQEIFPKDNTLDLTYELTYWRWGLETAQAWRQRLGLPREAHWDHVLTHLARPTVVGGRYLFAESAPDTYENPRWVKDHPAVLGALGMLPGPGIEPEIMRSTLNWIWEHWDWPDTWGWDYPMVAMTAARLGDARKAVDALLLDTPKNGYRVDGHNHQRPGLTIYLPGNGGLLYAAAMMAAGWDGAPKKHAPGFPDDGSWTVRAEGLRPAP